MANIFSNFFSPILNSFLFVPIADCLSYSDQFLNSNDGLKHSKSFQIHRSLSTIGMT